MPNIELLEQTLETIKANPKHWDQGVWRCSTGMCFAGWAAQLAGGQWVDDSSDSLVPEVGDVTGAWTRPVSAEERAMRVLEIEEEDADWLFAGCNTLEMIEGYVLQLKVDGHIYVEEDYDDEVYDD
jgi:hypothetical protein